MRLNAPLLLSATLAMILSITGIAPASAQSGPAADVTAIDNLYANWRKAVESGDIPGYVAVLDSDVRLLPPGAEAIVGAANYGKFLEPVFAAATYRIEVLRMPVIEVIGDVATAEYDYVIHLDLKNPEEGVQQAGALTASRTSARYIDVLRRNEKGEWRVWRHAWQNKAE